MKQYPSSIKYKKNHKIKSSLFVQKEQKTFHNIYGTFGLRVLEPCKLTYAQIEACRKSIRRNLRKKGRILLRTFTNISITKKAMGSRMGKGKGNHDVWVCPVKAGSVLCEVAGVAPYKAVKALSSAGSKIPVLTKVLKTRY